MSTTPPVLLPPNGSIFGVKAYGDYSPILDVSTMQAFIPFVYICPTLIVMLTILIMYGRARKSSASSTSSTMDHNIFVLIMCYFLFNMLFFVGDYLHLNLPSSGLATRWCARTEPSRWFALLHVYAYYSNLGVIICPFLVCLIRLTILLSPRHNERYCRLIMSRFAIPFLFIAPLLLVMCNVTVTGYCRQMDAPFTFGSLIIWEGEEAARLNIIIHFSFSCTIFLSTVVMSSVMFYKLRMTVFETSSNHTKKLSKKAERSLWLTMASSLVPFVMNSINSITFLFARPHYFHVLFLRPIGNDYETVMMPWVLFLTHPMFSLRKRKASSKTSVAWMGHKQSSSQMF